jgi:hypothetical protein
MRPTATTPAGRPRRSLAGVNGPHLVALVPAGARFDKGMLVERPDEDEAAGVAA